MIAEFHSSIRRNWVHDRSHLTYYKSVMAVRAFPICILFVVAKELAVVTRHTAVRKRHNMVMEGGEEHFFMRV